MVTFSTILSLCLYITVYGVSSLSYSLRHRFTIDGKEKKWPAIVLISFLPVFIGTFRWYVGGDWIVYHDGYSYYRNIDLITWIKSNDIINSSPIGMLTLIKAANLFGDEKWYWFFLSTLMYLPVVISLINEWDTDANSIGIASWIYLFGYFSIGFNITKQVIALALVFYGLKFVYNRQFFLFFLTILLAMAFHMTAIIALPIYFIWSKEGVISSLKKIVIVAFSFGFIIYLDNLLIAVGGRWANYAETKGTDNLTFYIYFFWLLVFIYFYKDLVKLDERNKLLFIMYIIGVIFSILGFWSIFGKRIADFFLISNVLLLAQIPQTRNGRERSYLKLGIISYTLFIFIVQIMIKGQVGIFPYTLNFGQF